MITHLIYYISRLLINLADIFTDAVLPIIFFFNIELIIYFLYKHIRFEKTFVALSLNIFYLFSRGNEHAFSLSEEEIHYSKGQARISKVFLRFFTFLLFVSLCSNTSLKNLHTLNFKFILYHALCFAYLLWSYLCVLKADNDRAYAFPLILNPCSRRRFRKRYRVFMKSAYGVLCFNSHLDLFLGELAVEIKKDWDWASSKNISGEDVFVKERLLRILEKNYLLQNISESDAEKLEKIIASIEF